MPVTRCKLIYRTVRIADLLIIRIPHKPQTAAVPTLIRKVDYGWQATVVFVEERFFIHSDRSELQKVNFGGVQPPVRVNAIKAVLCPSLR